jgi:DtxR family Mn-dependent transcriptional regulator
MSVSVDNFLKSVYTLSVEDGLDVTGSLLAAKLNVSSAAVTDMVRKLAVKGLVDYTPYKVVALTRQGELIAKQVLRKHRLWELFLYRVLKMDLSDVHVEAEQLEHQTSMELMSRLDEFLGFPQFDPHGEPIPSQDGSLPDDSDLVALSSLKIGDKARIMRLLIREKEVFDLFNHYGILPGAEIEILCLFDFDGSIEIKVNNQKVLIPAKLINRIFCKEEKQQ